MMLSTMPQYNAEAPLPSFSDTNNSSYADMFPGAKVDKK